MCVNLAGKGYDYGAAPALLDALGRELSFTEVVELQPYLRTKQLSDPGPSSGATVSNSANGCSALL